MNVVDLMLNAAAPRLVRLSHGQWVTQPSLKYGGYWLMPSGERQYREGPASGGSSGRAKAVRRPGWSIPKGQAMPAEAAVDRDTALNRLRGQGGRSRRAVAETFSGPEAIRGILSEALGGEEAAYALLNRSDRKKIKADIETALKSYFAKGGEFRLPDGTLLDKDNFEGADYFETGDRWVDYLMELPFLDAYRSPHASHMKLRGKRLPLDPRRRLSLRLRYYRLVPRV